MTDLTIAEIWRYPVKSMGGERLRDVHLTKGGIPFDRGWAVRDESDKTIRGAKHFGALMNCHAAYLLDTPADPVPKAAITFPDGRVMVSDDTRIHRALSDLVGRAVTLWPLQPRENDDHYRAAAPADVTHYLRAIFALEPDEPLPDLGAFPPDVLAEISVYASPRGTYFDAFPVNLVTQASLNYLAGLIPGAVLDVRRFRPNFLVAGNEAAASPIEFAWTGHEVSLGAARLAAVMRCPRCIMTTRAQSGAGVTLPQDSSIMRAMVRETEQNLSVYCTVSAEGRVSVDDPVTPHL